MGESYPTGHHGGGDDLHLRSTRFPRASRYLRQPNEPQNIPCPPLPHRVSYTPMQPAASLPHNISVLLHAARTLLTYGRHLIDTVRQRATAPNFDAIAACFGTTNLTTILAHLNRGILRAAALERVLLA